MLHLTMPALSYTTFHAAFETEPDVPISDPFSSQLHQHEAVHYRWSHHDSHGVTGIDLGFGEQSRDYADIPGELYVIDPASDEVSEIINLRTIPYGIAASPGGMVYIVAFEGLIPVDISSGSVGVALTDFPGGSGLAFDSDGNGYVVVADWTGAGGDKLLVMDASGNLVGTHTPGGGASIIAVRD